MRTCRLNCCWLVIVSSWMLPWFVNAAENLPDEAAVETSVPGDVMLLPLEFAPAVDPDEGCLVLGEDGTGLGPSDYRFRTDVNYAAETFRNQDI